MGAILDHLIDEPLGIGEIREGYLHSRGRQGLDSGSHAFNSHPLLTLAEKLREKTELLVMV